MPSEVRHVVFGPAEAARAVLDHLLARGAALPRGTVVGWGVAEVPPGEGVAFRIAVAPDRAAADRRVEFGCAGPDLAAALVARCRGRGVRLPRRAGKALVRFGPCVALVLTLGDDAAADAALVRGRLGV